ncbi:MAG: hypothetical protein U0165_20090, partial [Polyangiaceae bacterium]
MSDEAYSRASERVATHFSRAMNAATSRYGVLADVTISAGIAAVPFVLFLRQLLAQETTSPLTFLLGILAVAPIVSTVLIGIVLRNAREEVIRWLAEKPFPIDNLNALLNGLGDSFDVTFQADVAVPERNDLQPLLDKVSDDALFIGRKEEQSKVEMRTGVIDSKRLPLRSTFLRYER